MAILLSNQNIIPYLGCLLFASSLLTDAEINDNKGNFNSLKLFYQYRTT